MDSLGDPLTTRQSQPGWEITMEPYLSGQYGFIDDPDRQFGNDSFWTLTRTQSDGPEPLATPVWTSVVPLQRIHFTIEALLLPRTFAQAQCCYGDDTPPLAHIDDAHLSLH
jgi:hypothetical protein